MSRPNRDHILVAEADVSPQYVSFYRKIATHTSWLPRRVDRWSYVGGGQWRRDISFDLNGRVIRRYLSLAGFVPESYVERPNQSACLLDRVALPFLEMEKYIHFSKFDLCDRSGASLHLLPSSVTAKYCLLELIGVINKEREVRGLGPDHTLEGNYWLQAFLAEWFYNDCPTDADGNYIRLDSEHCDTLIHCALKNDCRYRKRMSEEELKSSFWGQQLPDPEQRRKVLDQLEADIDRFFEDSPVFKFFVKTYGIKRLFYVQIDPADESHSLLKCRYESTWDLFLGSLSKESKIQRTPFSPWAYFEPDLDGAAMAEVNYVTIIAPEGMRFARHPKASPDKFRVVDLTSSGASLFARGTFTTDSITLHARHRWKADNEHPQRRVPLFDENEKSFRLQVALLPDMGKRLVGYLVLFLLSLLLTWVPALSSSFQLVDPSRFGLSLIVSLVPIGTFFLATHDEASYIRRRSLLIPTCLSIACIVVDIGAFLFSLSGCRVPCSLAVTVTVLFAAFAVWWIYVAFKRQYHQQFMPRERRRVSEEFAVRTDDYRPR